MTYNSSNNIIQAPKKIGSYYFKKSKDLTDKFYEQIIELENEIQLNPHPSIETARNLGSLYKTAIETFSGVSEKKVKFYNRKMQQLIIITNKITKNKDKKPTKWSKYMQNHKKNTNKFMLFLQIETSISNANDILDNKEKNFLDGYKEVETNLDSQAKKFLEMKKKKKIRKNKRFARRVSKDERLSLTGDISLNFNNLNDIDQIKGRSDKIDFMLNDFMKKFHYIYLHSKIFEAPIEKLNAILEKVFLHKIDKYYYYQDQIKQFELMLGDNDENDNNEHDEEIDVYLKRLKNERKTYYIVLETLIKETNNKIKKICEETQINEDKNAKKYLDELMGNISQIFI
jgi:hypothetical protein